MDLNKDETNKSKKKDKTLNSSQINNQKNLILIENKYYITSKIGAGSFG